MRRWMDGLTIQFGRTEVLKLTVTDIQTYVLDRRRQNLTHFLVLGRIGVNGILDMAGILKLASKNHQEGPDAF